MAFILVVDDSRLTRVKIREHLEQSGHEVEEASHADEGMRKIQARKPDCLIVDLLMPGLSGIEMIQNLKENGFVIPSIVLTADIQDTTKEKCIRVGASSVIHKPPKKEQLDEAIAGAMLS